jgi:hypothetical protein
MKNDVLLEVWRYLLPVPPVIWQGQVNQSAVQNQQALSSMFLDHQRVRNFIVRQLPHLGQPLLPELIARELNLPLEQVISILDDLERRMSFLYRNGTESVVWAYPVTVDQTPHQATISGGESTYAARAIDAIALPFVQGRLREEKLSASIQTECVDCKKPFQLKINSELNIQIITTGAYPVLFIPMVDFDRLEDPSIIDAF